MKSLAYVLKLATIPSLVVSIVLSGFLLELFSQLSPKIGSSPIEIAISFISEPRAETHLILSHGLVWEGSILPLIIITFEISALLFVLSLVFRIFGRALLDQKEPLSVSVRIDNVKKFKDLW